MYAKKASARTHRECVGFPERKTTVIGKKWREPWKIYEQRKKKHFQYHNQHQKQNMKNNKKCTDSIRALGERERERELMRYKSTTYKMLLLSMLPLLFCDLPLTISLVWFLSHSPNAVIPFDVSSLAAFVVSLFFSINSVWLSLSLSVTVNKLHTWKINLYYAPICNSRLFFSPNICHDKCKFSVRTLDRMFYCCCRCWDTPEIPLERWKQCLPYILRKIKPQ